mmetsp:Transcript_153806/g.493197  ORF Transcript_153806/g.493197 Transcript_153806/m.493197 type:complete len:316 (-) Transcript_153806:571-1518(-)
MQVCSAEGPECPIRTRRGLADFLNGMHSATLEADANFALEWPRADIVAARTRDTSSAFLVVGHLRTAAEDTRLLTPGHLDLEGSGAGAGLRARGAEARQHRGVAPDWQLRPPAAQGGGTRVGRAVRRLLGRLRPHDGRHLLNERVVMCRRSAASRRPRFVGLGEADGWAPRISRLVEPVRARAGQSCRLLIGAVRPIRSSERDALTTGISPVRNRVRPRSEVVLADLARGCRDGPLRAAKRTERLALRMRQHVGTRVGSYLEAARLWRPRARLETRRAAAQRRRRHIQRWAPLTSLGAPPAADVAKAGAEAPRRR